MRYVAAASIGAATSTGPKRDGAQTVRAAPLSRSCGSRARPCGRARPRAASSRTRSGTSVSMASPMAIETSRPTRSSRASGPIGWPAPSFMHASTWSGAIPVPLEQAHGVEQVREQQPVDDEARQVGGDLDGGLVQRLAQRVRPAGACPRSASAGKASSTSAIRGTGLKTCSATKRLRPPAGVGERAAPTATRWSWRARRRRSSSSSSRPSSSRLGLELLDDRLDHERGVRPARRGRSRRATEPDASGQLLDPAAGALGGLRRACPQHDVAVLRRPPPRVRVAMAPLPAMPRRSCMSKAATLPGTAFG